MSEDRRGQSRDLDPETRAQNTQWRGTSVPSLGQKQKQCDEGWFENVQ